MVAALLRLRFRVLANTLQRNTFQLVATIVGGLLTAAAVPLVLAAMAIASFLAVDETQAVVVLGGSALLLGWIVVPLLFDGVDRTLDPLKLARFPLPTATLMTAMFVVGVAWFPGLATIIVSLSTAIAWREYPLAAAVAVISGLAGAATCVAASQLSTAVAGTLLRGRRPARMAIGALGAILLVLPAALAALGDAAVRNGDAVPGVATALEVLGWSPLGAVWSVPGRLASGDAAGAAVAAAIALASLVGTLWLWLLTVRASSARGRPRGSTARASAAGIGLLGWMPASPTGAIVARSLIYWFRDGRQARQLLLLPVLPALMLIWWRLFDVELIGLLIGPIVATLLPLSAFAGLSYDGTAFAAQLAAGVRGVQDRLARAVALLIIAAPATVIVQTAVAIVLGRQRDLPALLGLALGILLIAVGVVSVSSARVVVPMPRAGRTPFAAQPGAATASIFASYAVALAVVILALPLIAAVFLATTDGAPLLGWLALVASLGLGVGVMLGGVVIGGRMLDASGPEMLARLRLVRV